jgi:peptidoglycan/xylan/chitin deacetylase (PgdA/CDA1 family)
MTVQRNSVTILLFHDIDPKGAREIFQYLSNNYAIIDLNFFIDLHYKKKQQKLPKKALIITFDDGHIRNYKLLPIIKELKLPITIFLCSSIVNSNKHYWFKYQNLNFPINTLKQRANKERLAVLRQAGFEQDFEFGTPQALTKTQIDEMSEFVNFQSHTKYHPILPMCDDEEAKKELNESKSELEKKFNLCINTLSYPNGDYCDRDITFAKEAGYFCGITVDFGFNSLKSDIFKLKRISVNDSINLDELIVKSSGVWAFFRTLNGKSQNFGYKESTSE